MNKNESKSESFFLNKLEVSSYIANNIKKSIDELLLNYNHHNEYDKYLTILNVICDSLKNFSVNMYANHLNNSQKDYNEFIESFIDDIHNCFLDKKLYLDLDMPTETT